MMLTNWTREAQIAEKQYFITMIIEQMLGYMVDPVCAQMELKNLRMFEDELFRLNSEKP
jgi:hypothetical protein